MPEVGDRDQSGYSPEERALIWLDSFPLDGGVKRRLLDVAGSGVRLVHSFPEISSMAFVARSNSFFVWLNFVSRELQNTYSRAGPEGRLACRMALCVCVNFSKIQKIVMFM